MCTRQTRHPHSTIARPADTRHLLCDPTSCCTGGPAAGAKHYAWSAPAAGPTQRDSQQCALDARQVHSGLHAPGLAGLQDALEVRVGFELVLHFLQEGLPPPQLPQPHMQQNDAESHAPVFFLARAPRRCGQSLSRTMQMHMTARCRPKLNIIKLHSSHITPFLYRRDT